MKSADEKIERILQIFVVLFIILVGIFAEGPWAQAQPTIISQTPQDGVINVLINTPIRIIFDTTMDTGASGINKVQDEYGQDVAGAIQWVMTANPNDTLIFIPQNGLKPATGYYYEGFAQSGTGGVIFGASFITKFSMADATPPTVQTTYPSPGMTIGTAESIHIGFSEAMNPSSIITPGNITLTGLCMGGATDYTVNYEIGDGEVKIRKNTPFAASLQCTVTVTTNVRDVRGNPLKNPYSWSFWTGTADLTPPTVTQTIPTDGDIKVSLYPNLHAIFSKEMDESTFNTNITLYDNTASTGVPINIYGSGGDDVTFGAQSTLTYNHNYTVTIGTGVKDRAGNSLVLKTWSFTTYSGIDSDPMISRGLSRDDQKGQIFNGSTTKVKFKLSAWDDVTNPLTVTAAIPGHGSRSLTGSPGIFGGYDYKYNTPGNESLLAGDYIVTFTITDVVANTVTFDRNIYIFSASPTLSSPLSGASGQPVTPTFTWSYAVSPRPMYYKVAVFDGDDMNTAPMIWMGIMVDQGSGDHSITIPADKPLSPNKTYYWGVMGSNREENGETYAGLWPFTTGGTPPPAPYFIWTYVRSEDLYPSNLQGSLRAKVGGVSPADIVQLKVTTPGGFQYIFTEDDIMRSEQSLGQYYFHNTLNPLLNGTYTFSLTDSAGRIVTATQDFTSASVSRVDYTTMLPINNTYVNTTTPTFSWAGCSGCYYRVAVWDWNTNQVPVYVSDFIQETPFTVPPGYLLPDTPYNWRVDVYDAPFGSNNSRSNNLRFSTGSGSYTPIIEWVFFYNENSYYFGPIKSITANVVGPLPNDVSLFNVSGPGLNHNFQQTDIVYNLAWTHGSMYGYGEPGAVAGGSYTFTLNTPRGNPNYPKDLTPAVIPIVDQSSMLPTNNAYLTNLTPTFSWNTVGGSYYYRILIMDWRSRFVIYASTRTLNLLSLTIPPGILKAGTPYMWKVEVYDDASGTVADNRSTSGWNCFTTPRRWLIDFDGDRKTDILWRHATSGLTAMWLMNGTTISSSAYLTTVSDTNWHIVDVGDFDGDSNSDILWRHATTGETAVWFMNGKTMSSSAYLTTVSDTNWQIVGVGDFNGDGNSDILWHHATSGETAIWLMNGTTISSSAYLPTVSDTNWQIVGVGDFNGDGNSDILWRHATSGLTATWLMNGTTISSSAYLPTVSDTNWQIVGVGDLNGDSNSDILWHHATTGETAIWLMNGTTISSSAYLPTVSDTNWQIVGVGDLNGDSNSDILWHHATSGETAIWLMNWTTISSSAYLLTVSDTNWQIMNR